MREIKEDLNEQRNVSYSWAGQLPIINMSIFLTDLRIQCHSNQSGYSGICSGLQPAIIGVFTPWKLTNTTNQRFLFSPRGPFGQHTTEHNLKFIWKEKVQVTQNEK